MPNWCLHCHDPPDKKPTDKQPSVTLKDSAGTTEDIPAKTGSAGQRADDADKNIVNATDTNAGRTDCKDNAQEENGNPAVMPRHTDKRINLRENGGGTGGDSEPENGMPVSVLCDGTHTNDDGGDDIESSQNNDEQNEVTNVDNVTTSAGDDSKSLEKPEANAENGQGTVNEGSANK